MPQRVFCLFVFTFRKKIYVYFRDLRALNIQWDAKRVAALIAFRDYCTHVRYYVHVKRECSEISIVAFLARRERKQRLDLRLLAQ